MLETPQPSSAALPERYATDVSAFNQRQVPSVYRREATLEQIGLKRTYALLQQLDAMVNNACQGV